MIHGSDAAAGNGSALTFRAIDLARVHRHTVKAILK
jgi:hypothetical protein